MAYRPNFIVFFFKFLHLIVEDKCLKHSRGITQNTALIISVSPLNGVSYLEYLPEPAFSFILMKTQPFHSFS